MAASTDIKFYVHSNNNAPQLQNAYGSMIGVLDAFLVNGINIGSVSTLTADGTTVTAIFSTPHNLMQFQVLKIIGANQVEYNGEHCILSIPNATTVTFEIPTPPSTTSATGTITASLPPLGWEKPFSSINIAGGGKAAYRSKNMLLPSRPYLRVVDELDPCWDSTFAKYAKVGMVENLSDIDTIIGLQAPYDSANPSKNWIGTGGGGGAVNGWAKWYYSRWDREHAVNNGTGDGYPTSNGVRSYLLIGNADTFYILPSVVPGNNEAVSCYGFGAFNTYFSSESSNNFLLASFSYASASTLSERVCTYGSIANYNRSSNFFNAVLQRGVNLGNFTWASTRSESFIADSYSGYYISGYGDVAGNISNLGQVFIIPLKLHDSSTLRGELPFVNFIPHNKPYMNLQTMVTGSRKMLTKDLMGFASGAGFLVSGSLAFNLGNIQ